jgi:Uma2 family endonuclease
MSAAVLPPWKRYTRDEVERMLDSGVFEGRRFELIDGELIDKMGQKPPHASAIVLVHYCLVSLFGFFRVRAQLPIDVAPGDRERNEPEPDFAVLLEKKPEFDHRHPRGDELLLVVEVADSSIRTDTRTKRDLYARAAVPEYWIIDLPSRRLIVHRTPASGVYQRTMVFAEGESVSTESAPDAVIPVANLMPPRDQLA